MCMRKFFSRMFSPQHFWQLWSHTGGLQGSTKQDIRISEHCRTEAEDGRTNSSTAQGALSHLQCKELNATPKWQHSHVELDNIDSCWISAITMWKDVQSTWELQEVNPVQEQEVGTCKLHANLSYSTELKNADDEASLPTKLKSLCWLIHKTEIIK